MFTIKPLALLLKINRRIAEPARSVGCGFGKRVNVEKTEHENQVAIVTGPETDGCMQG